MFPKVSAVFITRRLQLPPAVSKSIQHFPFDEVIVEPRCPGVHRRYDLAARARNEIVYVQDDDCTLNIRHLFRSWTGNDTIYATGQGHKEIYDKLCGSKVFLLGWGCFFKRELAEPTRWAPYVERFGAIPSHEADRVFTYFAQPARAVILDIMHFKYREAMSRDNPDHYQSRDKIIGELMSLGVTT